MESELEADPERLSWGGGRRPVGGSPPIRQCAKRRSPCGWRFQLAVLRIADDTRGAGRTLPTSRESGGHLSEMPTIQSRLSRFPSGTPASEDADYRQPSGYLCRSSVQSEGVRVCCRCHARPKPRSRACDSRRRALNLCILNKKARSRAPRDRARIVDREPRLTAGSRWRR
jgi:hypothetical protein